MFPAYIKNTHPLSLEFINASKFTLTIYIFTHPSILFHLQFRGGAYQSCNRVKVEYDLDSSPQLATTIHTKIHTYVQV